MGIQELIVFALIGSAIIYTGYHIYLIFQNKPENSCGCSSCDAKDKIKEFK